MSLTVDELAKEIGRIYEGDDAWCRMVATGLLPFIERHIAAGQQGAKDYPHEQMDAIAVKRYKVLPTNAGFWPFCVTAGDGERQLYKGHRNSCEAVARQLTGAFLDGGFAAAAMLAAPQPPKPAGAVPLPEEMPLPAFREEYPERYGYALGWNDYRRAMIVQGGDSREAAGRADAVPDADPRLIDIWRALDSTLGDTDPYLADDMTDEDIRDDFPVWWATRKLRAMIDAAPIPQQPAAEGDDIAVDRFAEAMKAKMAAARAKGRGGWEGPTCNADILSRMLRDHVEKGDPRDVANFCMMLWNRGEAIQPSPTPAADAGEVTDELDSADQDVSVWELIQIAQECGAAKDQDDNNTWWTLDLRAFYALEARMRDAVSSMRYAALTPEVRHGE